MKELVHRVVSDWHFWLAVLLGPIVWLALWWMTGRSMPNGVEVSVLLTGVILYPMIEELAFRGFVQTRLLEKSLFARMPIPELTNANIVTSFLFASFHLFNQPPLWATLIFFPSLVFGYLRDRYDAVAPSIVVHGWYNLGFLILAS